MENNETERNSQPETPSWLTMKWIWLKLGFKKHVDSLTALFTLAMVVFAGLHYCSLVKQTESLQNQNKLIRNQNVLIGLQTTATINNPANRPSLQCSYVSAHHSLKVFISNEGGRLKQLESSEVSFVRVFYNNNSWKHHDLPTKVEYIVKDVDFIETNGYVNLHIRQHLNLDSFLVKCKPFQEITIVPYLVIKVVYLDMFKDEDEDEGKEEKYFLIQGAEYPSKTKTVNGIDAGWSSSFWDANEFVYTKGHPNITQLKNNYGDAYFVRHKNKENCGGQDCSEQEICNFISGVNLRKETPTK